MTNLTTQEKAERIAKMTDGLEDADGVFDLVDETITEAGAGDDDRVNVDRSALVDDVYRYVFGIDEPEADRTNAATTTTDEMPVGGVKNTEEGVTAPPDSRVNWMDAVATPADRGEEAPAAHTPSSRRGGRRSGSRVNASSEDDEDDGAPVGGVANTASRTNTTRVNQGHVECEFCTFSGTSEQVRVHQRRHPDGLVNCEDCGERLPSERALERHRVHKHNDGYLGAGVGNITAERNEARDRVNRGGGIIDLG